MTGEEAYASDTESFASQDDAGGEVVAAVVEAVAVDTDERYWTKAELEFREKIGSIWRALWNEVYHGGRHPRKVLNDYFGENKRQ